MLVTLVQVWHAAQARQAVIILLAPLCLASYPGWSGRGNSGGMRGPFFAPRGTRETHILISPLPSPGGDSAARHALRFLVTVSLCEAESAPNTC